MLKCIQCGREYKEEINKTCCDEKLEHNKPYIYTNLYSTSIKLFPFKESPLEKIDANLWLKREDKNEISGTFKDRKTVFVSHHKKFALASSGNQAISLANFNIQMMKYMHYITFYPTYLYISPDIDNKKLNLLKQKYGEITFTDRILTSKELCQDEEDRYNITNGMDPIGASAYYSLAMELEPHNFDNIIVPCGSGELYTALSCYFHLLRKKNSPKIIPVKSKLKETDALFTDFVASGIFLDYFAENFKQYPYVIQNTETLKSLQSYSDKYNCELSSAVVFQAFKDLKVKGKTCLIITGCKK